jgi:nucleoside-diphosphate kinase
VHNRDIRERTLMLVKPDGVLRGLCGEILARFERAGLAIVGLKMVQVSREQAERHYAADPEWLATLGQKTLKAYERHQRDPVSELGTTDPLSIGHIIRGWLVDYITQAPLVACVLEGSLAVATVRKLAGDTMPADAMPGTIRGDYSTTSAVVTNRLQAAVRNLVHASSSRDEAEREIATWFLPHELCQYTPASWTAVFGPGPLVPGA